MHIAELRSISRAAAALHIAQPALTRQLHQLEAELETKLLDRHSRGVVPTPAGTALLERARAIVDQVDQIKSQVTSQGDRLTGSVSIGMPIPITPIVSTRLLMRAAVEYPNISLRIVEGFSSLIHEWLSSGSITLAILYGASFKRSIQSIPLVVEDFHLVGSKAPRNRKVKFYTPRDLAKLPLILPNEPHPICEALSRAGINAEVRARADAISVMKDFAERDIGYVVLPLSAVIRDVEAGRLTAVPIRQPSISQHVCLCYSSLRRLAPAAEHILRFIEQETRAIVNEGQWPGGALCG